MTHHYPIVTAPTGQKPRAKQKPSRKSAERIQRCDLAYEIEEAMKAQGVITAVLAQRCGKPPHVLINALADPESRTADWWGKVRAKI